MRTRVFLSCGQRPNEIEIAGKLGELLEARGFDVYIAIDVQTILDINAGIIRELKNSDCYLFVNFRREQLTGGKYRGALFSNQELAIAYAFGFERILVVNQDGVLPEGILKYMGINTETFVSISECYSTVERVIDRSAWTTDYSRRLRADRLRFSEQIIQYKNLVGQFLYIDVLNQRPDIAALEATARLSEFGPLGGAMLPSPIRSPLKATGRYGFSHTIFPRSWEAFDLLCVGMYSGRDELFLSAPAASGTVVEPITMPQERQVLLNTAFDVIQAPTLPITAGVWQLRYEFFAIDFPVLTVIIELDLTDWGKPKPKILAQEIS
jgi:hypothetical protein